MFLSDDDLKEIFGLFSSCSRYERDQVYGDGVHNYRMIDLSEEYELTQPKIEFSRDAWRAIMYFLHRRGYELKRNNEVIDLGFSEKEFLDC